MCAPTTRNGRRSRAREISPSNDRRLLPPLSGGQQISIAPGELMRLLLTFLLTINAALGADYPTRPIRLLIGFPPGAGMDAVARPFAQRMGELLGQPMIVQNRPGAG